MIALDIDVEAEGWDVVPDLLVLCRRAADAALASCPTPPDDDVAAALLLADDAAVRALNLQWRGHDKPTNVLSFPAPVGPLAGGTRLLGDLVLAWDTVAREAAQEGKAVPDHAAHLVVHGVLHLLGLDHETEAEADAMEAVEVAALARLGIADPYGAAA